MIIYQRNISTKLITLRLTLFILIAFYIYASKTHQSNLGYFIAVAILFLGIIVVKNIVFLSNSFEVSKYYFFGLIPIKWKFSIGDAVTVSSSDYFMDDANPDLNDDAPLGLGCLLFLFSFVWPYKITKMEYQIKKLDADNKVQKSVYIQLDFNEYNHLRKYLTITE